MKKLVNKVLDFLFGKNIVITEPSFTKAINRRLNVKKPKGRIKKKGKK
jgi:hypothetical protein